MAGVLIVMVSSVTRRMSWGSGTSDSPGRDSTMAAPGEGGRPSLVIVVLSALPGRRWSRPTSGQAEPSAPPRPAEPSDAVPVTRVGGVRRQHSRSRNIARSPGKVRLPAPRRGLRAPVRRW